MSKELEYEFNNFANLLHKDCMNLMECLKKQSEDNKPILYLGKHYQKVILPYEEYQKMCNRLEEQEKKTYTDELKLVEKKLKRLESIDNAEPSEALECLEDIYRNGVFIREVSFEKQHPTNISPETNKSIDVQCNAIKQALIKAQKEHKALEIIKEKYPDVVEVKLCNNYEHYKLRMSSKHDTEIVKIDWNDKSLVDYLKLLTEEEFNLLKEILGC